MIAPHGGRLINRIPKGTRRERLLDKAQDLPRITIQQDTIKDLQNIANGAYSPITGFLDQNNFNKVLEDKTLEDGTVWTIPIILDVDEEKAQAVEDAGGTTIEDEDGQILATIDVDETYMIDKDHAVKQLYGTDDRDHPGVQMYYEKEDYAVAGDIQLLNQGFTDHEDYYLAPKETRVLFKENEWDTVVGFQTRNAPHRGHEYLQKSALEQVDAILIHPKIGSKKPGDYRDEVILKSYRSLLQNYYHDKAAMSIFAAKMRYMGPREAVFDAIVRKNYGCTHFIVGRDHAGVGDYYDEFASQEIFDEFGTIGVEPMFYDYAFYCRECEDTVSEKICPHGADARVTPSGTKIRGMLADNDTPPTEMMRPEVAETIQTFEQPFVEEDL